MKLLLLACVYCVALSLEGVASAQEAEVIPISTFDHSHAGFTLVLQEFVTLVGVTSYVNYRELKRNDAGLNHYLSQVSAVTKAQFGSFSEAQQIAFLVNVYNAFTLKLVIDHYPVESIKDIGGFFGSPWKQKIVALFGKFFTLDDVEHRMLRKDYQEARIHFVLVCAAKGCPRLHNEAYHADELEQQLEGAARTFLRDTSRNRFDALQSRLYLSKLFSWFGGDFDRKYGSVRAYVARHISAQPVVQEQIVNGDISIAYTDYDWSLNDVL